MKTVIGSLLNISLLIAVSVLASVGQQQRASLPAVSFMAGCWEMRVPAQNIVITEQWMAPSGDAMLGMNRTLKNGKMSEFEFLRIIEKSGTLYYVALPSANDSPTSFELKSVSATSVVFENLGHDFPQTITYSLTGTNALTAAVEGKGSERPRRRRIEFPMKRIKCS